VLGKGHGRIQFGRFKLDPSAQKLLRDGRAVKIQPQALRVLSVLVEYAGKIVTREELRDRIWGESTFVEFDQGLNYSIRQIRLALGDNANAPTFIETLPKQGYRFIASLSLPESEQAGESPSSPETAPSISLSGHRRFRRGWAIPVLAFVLGLVTWWTPPARNVTIAVLPIANVSPDSENEYFSRGLTEEIVQSLSMINGLEVISSGSSAALKQDGLDAREIGKRLNATELIQGTVRKQDDLLRITIQLIATSDGKTLWAGTYDRKVQDVFGIQEELAGSIASALRVKLGSVRRRYTDNVEAYEAYLRGRGSMESPGKAVPAMRYFEKAVALDANYALAHAAVAEAALAMDVTHQLPHEDAQPRARASAERAVDLDPMLPEAHTALAKVFAADYDWQGAERELRRAIQLNPNGALAHLSLGFSVLLPQSRFDEAIAEIRRSLALDPISSNINTSLTFALLLAGRYQEAERQAKRTNALDPRQPQPYLFLGQALYWQGKNQEAVAAMQEAEKNARPGAADGWLACADIHAGKRDEALQVLRDNLPGGTRKSVPNRRLLPIYACLGDKAHAIEALEKMYAEREPFLPVYLLYPELASIRSDPQFMAVRERINLRH
jgi:TolB-like protein/DNA-binding winged helix-turn-helix (wHTH) protein/Flp pilus assembly protein TadD